MITWLIFFLFLLGILGALVYLYFGVLLVLFTRSAPYVTTKRAVMRQMIDVAKISPGMTTLELGSGNGEISILAAKAGAKAIGLEFNPVLVWFARLRASMRGVSAATHFQIADIWKTKLPPVDVIFVYLLPNMMERLWPKLCQEYPAGTKVISNAFQFSDVLPVAQHGDVRVYETMKA